MRSAFMNMRLKLLATFVFLFLSAAAASAQSGTTYVLVFPDTTANLTDPRYPNNRYPDRAYLMIYSAVTNRVRIRGEGLDLNLLLEGRKFTTIDLMDSMLHRSNP